MSRNLLSIDWDYFISTKKDNWGSYIENKKNIINLWYKKCILYKNQGKNFKDEFEISKLINSFWNNAKYHFKFSNVKKMYVSDSHVMSYNVAKENKCDTVYLFDAHSDLGYGGLSSLEFEVNCANWLGKLFTDKLINAAKIVYSPFTTEKPEYFKEISRKFNISFISIDQLETNINVSSVHICRSGAWTPPWFDKNFLEFVNKAKLPYNLVECPERKFDLDNINLSDEIDYLLA